MGFLLTAAAVSGNCTTASSSAVTAPTTEKCQIGVTASQVAFGPTGGAGSITVSTSRDCTWAIASDAAWIALADVSEGQGPGAVPFTVFTNPVPAPRSTAIGVGDTRVQVTQAARACAFALSGTNGHIGADGGRLTVEVTALTGCAWAAASPVVWLGIVSGQSSNASGTVALSASQNLGSGRTAVLTIAGQAYTVVQDGVQDAALPTIPAPVPPGPGVPTPAPPGAPPPADVPPAVPPFAAPPSCSYAVSPPSVALGAGGGEASVHVTTQPQCAWSAASNSVWIAIVGTVAGSGTADVRLHLTPNVAATARQGAATIAGVSVVVSEEGQPPPLPSVELSGSVSSLSGYCPNLVFDLGGKSAATNNATQFTGGVCSDVTRRTRLTVTGLVQPSGAILATRVVIDRSADDNHQDAAP